ncbi:hypothetical protein L210DRAFT_3761225 [Boletus edulis BED1]|uniref:CST complex subunit STN1 n=1 Tax=Boletus edulis BED1 TaxID=1328754 RepID=A0AAD4BSJ0_BOLED|nr:hypothetical protein L210DRAFT_3761225 [Boletus edulis BED1]
MDRQIWQWTLTKDAIAPCFVRDVLAMRKQSNGDFDFFWLGHTPCRTVLLVGMVVGIQVYEKRTIYTIDDGTAVIDCVLRHPHLTLPAPAPRSPPRPNGGPGPKSNPQRLSPKKPRLDKAKLDSTEPPPPITELGYPVRVVGKVARHYQSKQIYADTIEPCVSSLDEIAHLERVINLHKTKYSLAIPFVPPPKSTSRILPLDSSASLTSPDANASVFSNILPPGPSTTSYTLPPPPMPMPLQNRNRHTTVTHLHSSYRAHTHVPSSPTTSSIASSTPSSPCKPSSPVKSHEAQRTLHLRHPSRLHTRDLTGNTFRLYVKHYMDNAPPPFPILFSSPSRSTCGALTTPTKHARDDDEGDEPTPRPRPSARDETRDEHEDGQTLGFTLSHLRRVPELALLAARVVRAEARKRDKADRERQRGGAHSHIPSSSSASTRLDSCKNGNASSADPVPKKMKRLFSWAVVKLYEEGSIILWDGDVQSLPVPPPPFLEGDQNKDDSGLWKGDGARSIGDTSVLCSRSYASSTSADLSASVLYTSSASASLYSHYHAPRRPGHRVGDEHDADADLGYVSDPGVDEEAYVPLTPRLLARYVREAVERECVRGGAGVNGKGMQLTPENLLAQLQRADTRWARVGVWAVEEALALLKAG